MQQQLLYSILYKDNTTTTEYLKDGFYQISSVWFDKMHLFLFNPTTQ